ncbi:MAG: helix-turn-helix domain-containing protein [Rhizobiaceae bacterium]
MMEVESFDNVWTALSDTPEEAANLKARSDLMLKLIEIIKAEDWTQAEAASQCHITQPRMNDLLKGRISKFSLDALVNIAAALGLKIQFNLEAA